MKLLKGTLLLISFGIWTLITICSLYLVAPGKFTSFITSKSQGFNFFYENIAYDKNLLFPKLTFKEPSLNIEDKEVFHANEITIGFSIWESLLNLKPTFYYFSGKEIFLDLRSNQSSDQNKIPFLLAESHFVDAEIYIYTNAGPQIIDLSLVSNQEFSSIIAEQLVQKNNLKNSVSIYQDKEIQSFSGALGIKDSKLITNLSSRISNALNFQFEVTGSFAIKKGIGSSNLKLEILPSDDEVTFNSIELDLLGVMNNQDIYFYRDTQIPSPESFFGFVEFRSNSIFIKSLDINDIYLRSSKVIVDSSLRNISVNKLGSKDFFVGAFLQSGRLQDFYFSKLDGLSGKLTYQNGALNFQSIGQNISIVGFDGLIRSYNLDLLSKTSKTDNFIIANLTNERSRFKVNFLSREGINKRLQLSGSNINFQDTSGLIAYQFAGIRNFLKDIDELEIKKFITTLYLGQPERNITLANIESLSFKNIPLKARDMVVDIDNKSVHFSADKFSVQMLDLGNLKGIYSFNSKDLYFEEVSKLLLDSSKSLLETSSHSIGTYSFEDNRFNSFSLLSDLDYKSKESDISSLALQSQQLRVLNFEDLYSMNNFSLNNFSFNSYAYGKINLNKPALSLELELPIQDKLLKTAYLDGFISGSTPGRINLEIAKSQINASLSSDLEGLKIESPLDMFSKERDQKANLIATFQKSASKDWSSDIRYIDHVFKANFYSNEESLSLNQLSSQGPNLNIELTKDLSGFTKIFVKDSNVTISSNKSSSTNTGLRNLPDINSRIILSNVSINNVLFNDLDVYLQKNTKAISLNKLFIKAESFSVLPFESRDAFISYRFDNNHYHLNGIYEFRDSAKLSITKNPRLGFDYLRFATRIQFEDLVKLKDIEGNISILGKELYFEDRIADSAALNLIGVFNLKRLLGKVINLDLSLNEYARTELGRIEGNLIFNKESARLSDAFFVETNAAKMAWRGEINKKNGYLDSLDLDLSLRIRLQENLPWYAGIIGGIPGVAGSVIFNELFQSELNDLSSYQYKVSGPINSPKIIATQTN